MSEENSADMLDCDAQLMEMFVANAADLLDEIESDLLKMEHMEGWDENLVNKVFRSAHTIKGESGFIGLEVIGKLAHSIENVLDNVRERVFVADGETINLLLDCFDELRKLTDDVDNSNDADVSKFVTQLDDLVARKIGGDSQTPAAQSPAEPACEEISTPDVTASKDTVSKDTVSEDTVSEDTPCEQATETIAVASPVPAKQLPGDVLIVDDDPMIQKMLMHHLNKNEVSTQAVASCGECMQVLQNNFYRVIVLDFDLPDGQGVDIIQKIKMIHPLAQIIMVTGDVNMHNVVNCLESGAIDFLPKTNNFDLIVEPILLALTRSHRWVSLLHTKRQAVSA